VRIRPQTLEGGHAQHGQPAAAKVLSGWDDESVSVGWTCANRDDVGRALDSGAATRYDYVSRVLRPEATQADVYNTVAPGLVDRILGTSDRPARGDALLFAYGQTGTGKTHTILGPDGSLY
jgi:hypothetical protein